MGNSVSRVVGCFMPRRDDNGGPDALFSEPLDEGLGHSFCYVRPAFDSPAHSPSQQQSEELSPEFSFDADTSIESDGHSGEHAREIPSFDSQKLRNESELKSLPVVDRSRVGWEKPKFVGNDKPKSVSETSFKAISGASVSANTTTPRSINSVEQFNSFSNIPYDRAAAFESTSSFSALPLQPVPRGAIGNSGPISGPLSGPMSGPLDNRGFLSGPLERGFLSGPLERGFMSGPLERGFMSGPIEPVDRSHFSAPLAGPFPRYLKRKRSSLTRFVTTMSGPVRKVITRTLSKTSATLARTHRSIVLPVKHFVLGEGKYGDKDCSKGSIDSPLDMVGYSSSDPDIKEGDHLQWAQGKAGEDRVHVVLSEEHGWLFVGIYDGFNGPDATDFLMSNLYPAIDRELKGLLWNQNTGFDLFNASPIAGGGSGLGREGSGGQRGDEVERQGGNFLARLGPMGLDHRNCDGCESNGGTKGVEPNQSEDVERDKLQEGQNVDGNHSCSAPVRVDGAAIDATINNLQKDCMLASNGDDAVRDCLLQDNGNMLDCHPCSRLERAMNGAEHNVAMGKQDKDCIQAENSCISANLTCEIETKALDAEGNHERDAMEGNGQAEENCKPVANGSGAEGRVMLEQEGKLAEDRLNVDQAGEQAAPNVELQLDTPEQTETGPVPAMEQKPVTGRNLLGLKVRQLRDRRREQHRKYLQWRYDWEQERLEAEERLRETLRQEESRDDDRGSADHDAVLKALARALEATEDAYFEMADRVVDENPELALMGSCVLVMLMKDEDVYIMNVGDSRAVLAQQQSKQFAIMSLSKFSCGQIYPQLNGHKLEEPERIGGRDPLLRVELERIIEETPTELEALEASYDTASLAAPVPGLSLLGALQLSSDHSTSIDEEVLRIRSEHPNDDTIISNDRVKGRLKVTRAFGAGFLKRSKWNNALLEMFRCDFKGTDPYISCNPFLHHHRLGPQDQFWCFHQTGCTNILAMRRWFPTWNGLWKNFLMETLLNISLRSFCFVLPRRMVGQCIQNLSGQLDAHRQLRGG